MNVASLLQDSPSDDRQSRLRNTTQQPPGLAHPNGDVSRQGYHGQHSPAHQISPAYVPAGALGAPPERLPPIVLATGNKEGDDYVSATAPAYRSPEYDKRRWISNEESARLNLPTASSGSINNKEKDSSRMRPPHGRSGSGIPPAGSTTPHHSPPTPYSSHLRLGHGRKPVAMSPPRGELAPQIQQQPTPPPKSSPISQPISTHHPPPQTTPSHPSSHTSPDLSANAGRPPYHHRAHAAHPSFHDQQPPSHAPPPHPTTASSSGLGLMHPEQLAAKLDDPSSTPGAITFGQPSFGPPPKSSQRHHHHRERGAKPSGSGGQRVSGHRRGNKLPSQFETDWEVKDVKHASLPVTPTQSPPQTLVASTSAPISGPISPRSVAKTSNTSPLSQTKSKPRPYHLGTYVYPASPFPIQLPVALAQPHIERDRSGREREREREIHFHLYVPRDHLPTSIPSGPQVWGGRPLHSNGKGRVYTDDSNLTLLPLHCGFASLGDYRRARGDLKITFCAVPKRRCPVRWIGIPGAENDKDKSDKDRVQSYSWGNSHDGGGVEVVSVEWLKANAAHSLSQPNRRARLREYAERRAALIPIPTVKPSCNLLTLAGLADEQTDLVIMSDVWRPSPTLPVGRKLEIEDEGDGKPTFRDGGISSNRILLFDTDGSVAYKYSPTTFCNTLFPPAVPPQTSPVGMADPSVYVSDRERPRKRRKLETPGGGPRKAVLAIGERLELETETGEIVVFNVNIQASERKWDVCVTRTPLATPFPNVEGDPDENSRMVPDGAQPADIKGTDDTQGNAAEGARYKDLERKHFDFRDESVVIIGQSANHDSTEECIFKATRWRWQLRLS